MWFSGRGSASALAEDGLRRIMNERVLAVGAHVSLERSSLEGRGVVEQPLGGKPVWVKGFLVGEDLEVERKLTGSEWFNRSDKGWGLYFLPGKMLPWKRSSGDISFETDEKGVDV